MSIHLLRIDRCDISYWGSQLKYRISTCPGAIGWMFVPLPHSKIPMSNPQCEGIRRFILMEVIRSGGGVLVNGIHTLKKDASERTLVPFYHARDQEECFLWTTKWAPSVHNICQALILISTLRTVKKIYLFVVYTTPSMAFCYSNCNRLRYLENLNFS